MEKNEDPMKASDKTIENNQDSEIDTPWKIQEICSACKSINVEIYTKNDHTFIMCLDCGRKELMD